MSDYGRRKTAGKNRGTSGDGRLLFILIGVVVILVLLILIVVFGARTRRKQQEESESLSLSVAESESESASIEESIAASVAESEAEAAKHVITECEDPEIKALVNSYFQYRLEGNAEELYRLFGRDTAVTPVDEEYAEKLSAQKSWVRSFDDIEIYLLPAESEDECIGIVKYRINFRRVTSKAPCIMYFYAVKDSDGSWVLRDDLVRETRERINSEIEKSGVQSMIDENTEALRELLETDSGLALMYASFMNGEIYSESNLDPDREQEIDLFEDPMDSVLLGE